MCSVCSKKHFMYFLAGAAAWEAFGHVLIHFSNKLPIDIFGITLTQQLNTIIIVVAGVISVGLLIAARGGNCENSCKC